MLMQESQASKNHLLISMKPDRGTLAGGDCSEVQDHLRNVRSIASTYYSFVT